MSKMNAVRIINLNYNNNAIRINDETFHLNGESTLLSLRNGGGKTVLVQMLLAPFVHKRYRDAKDRPFESYFTTNKPTFIMVEWLLDGGAGYVLTGMMVRKSQDLAEEARDELEIVSFISEYQERCECDILHIPVVEKSKKEIKLKNFTKCRQLFESYRKNKSIKFYFYDMNVVAQSRQYFDKLSEYQINYKEWETIMKKVNVKESGLSELFSDCRDEKGLVEKWFLDAVESKLNKDKDRMKEFESIVVKYVNQYKDNRAKIQKRDTIRLFEEQAEEIKKKAEKYQDATKNVKAFENRIASFIEVLNGLSASLEQEKKEIYQEELREEETILQIAYEEVSFDIHEKRKQQTFHLGSRDMTALERDGIEKECEKLQKLLHCQECARWSEEWKASRKDSYLAKERLSLFNKKEEDLEPERVGLGAKLWSAYSFLASDFMEQKEALEVKYQKALESLKERKERKEKYQSEILEIGTREGSLSAKIKSYDKEEERYNGHYGEELRRNILGEYEPAALDLKAHEAMEELEKKRKDLKSSRVSLDKGKEELKALERAMEDSSREMVVAGAKKEEEERELKRLEGEVAERKTILKYLELPIEAVFDQERILNASSKKLQEISHAKRGLEQELDELEKECRRLAQGKVLEVPEEFAELLDKNGISYVYGMEWLKRNGYSTAKNQKLVKNQPFIPYALIIGAAGIEKLSACREQVYTSSPIPIIPREKLETSLQKQTGGIVSSDQLNFYVMFNNNLLDEKKLYHLIQEKEERIAKKKEVIAQKNREYEDYFSRQEQIRNQRVTEKIYEGCQEKIQDLEAGIKEQHRRLEIQKEQAGILNQKLGTLREAIADAEKWMEWGKRRLEDFRLLKDQYKEYLEARKEKEKLSIQKEKLLNLLHQNQEQMEKTEGEMKSWESGRYQLIAKLEKVEEKCRIYKEFKSSGNSSEMPRILQEEEEFEQDIALWESRYEALTSQISGEKKELEEAVRKTAAACEKNEKELSYLEGKYGLSSRDYEKIFYHREEMERLERFLKRKKEKLEALQTTWNQEDKSIALLEQKIEADYQRMKESCDREEPLPIEQIVLLDFKARKIQGKERLKKKKEERKVLEERLRCYGENLTALTEYQHFSAEEKVEFEESFSKMGYKELGNFKGIMIRDYNESRETCRDKRESLTRTLNRVLRMDEFQEDFFKKPLENLLLLTKDSSQVILQLNTILSSYDSLMEKLEIDISMIEKEKDKIVELMEDYVKEVHSNLGRIDKNSTITIRERQIKMLKIKLPDWEENETVYQLRLQDYMSQITKRSIEILDKNENVIEYLGTKVSTKGLYDAVVGIGNIGIRLFKIEEHREYPITWADVAKNSGGEGFLSAFVILNSLLYYMRKDETDLFADRLEGKVLVMDNPFAQTNAAHLLKPLMDMAKKADTQLICLSGLGGESIYNRFDNIYVLNLVAANLRDATQYVKADHIRGQEEMVVSRIEVTEQKKLEF